VIDQSTVSTLAPKGGPAVQPTLSMAGITKHYDAIAALRNVSFDVLPGEVHALLGENGAGKSTLMNIASGATAQDEGTIVFAGETVEQLTPVIAQELGIAIVHQHPALLPDLTVAENIRVAVGPEHLRRRDPDTAKAMRSLLDEVHFGAHLEDRVSLLSVARRHLLELAKAFAVSPKLLILDEPTAPLSQDSVDRLFAAVRKLAAEGTAVVYITHRLGEVREIADRVTVLRDGANRGTSAVKDISDDDLLALIVGRTLEATFPPKHTAETDRPLLRVEGLSGQGFDDISLSAHKGEIVGIAGVVGNGQPALLRALAGRASATGTIEIDGKGFSRRALLKNAAYMPADRLTEGLMADLNVRENTALTALDRLTAGPFVRRSRELDAVERELSELAVRAPSLEAPVSALSGGNQQKVVMARAMLSQPAILVADEPTQGVDVGARAEIYRILREVSASGVPVVVASSDTLELEGLCDRVIVMSRGKAVADLDGDAVTEERIVHAAISATAHTAEQASRRATGSSRLTRFIEGDYAPVLVLAAVMLALGAYVLSRNDRYLSDFNINSVMFACAALGFISLGQTFALLLGGIDLSVGPLAGFLVVLASFFVLDGKSPAVWALGFVFMFLAALGVGLLNGSLIRFARFTPVAATLVTYIGLGGLAFTLRSAPDGYIASSVTEAISTKVGPVPVAFVVFVACALVLELGLRRGRLGLRLRAVGSDEESARRVGVPVNRTALIGYVGASLLTLLGAVVLLAQLGVGDPGQGTGYTLTSITAVVLGGTSLLGGRGTFIGTFMGAGLSVQVLNATVFLSLDQKWQYIFQGLLIVAAALIYSQVRRSTVRAHAQTA
jgi:ribose transport system ATP-binding protein